MRKIIVHKQNHRGEFVWKYEGDSIQHTETMIKLEAYFNREDVVTDYHTFRRNDLMVEWFYSDRWYNVFEMYDVESNDLKGWYCNISRPAVLAENAIVADDLALDVMVYPNGSYVILDEDEFNDLDIDAATRQQAEQGLQDLLALVESQQEMFSKIDA